MSSGEHNALQQIEHLMKKQVALLEQIEHLLKMRGVLLQVEQLLKKQTALLEQLVGLLEPPALGVSGATITIVPP